MREHDDRVVGNDAQIVDSGLIRLEHAMTNDGFVDLDAKEVSVGVRRSLFYQRFAITKTDFDDDRLVRALRTFNAAAPEFADASARYAGGNRAQD